MREAREFDRVEISDVRVEGGLREFPEVVARARARIGKEATYWDVLDDADRIREDLVARGHIEAVVDARLEGTVAVFGGDVGPRYRWRIEGMPSPPDITDDVRGALFEEEAVERGRERILAELRKRGHLRASVEVSSVPENGYRTLVFRAVPGPVLQADVVFPGATLMTPSRAAGRRGRRVRPAHPAPRRGARDPRRVPRAPSAGGEGGAGADRGRARPGPGQRRPSTKARRRRSRAVEYRGSTLERATLDTLSGIKVGTTYDPARGQPGPARPSASSTCARASPPSAW